MRGQGRVYRPTARGEKVAAWWGDFVLRPCACGKGDVAGRHRVPLGLAFPEHTQADAYEAMRAKRDACRTGRARPTPTAATLGAYVEQHLAAKALEVDERTGDPITPEWLESARRQLTRATEHFGAARQLASLDRPDVLSWLAVLRANGIVGGTARHHLNSLSNLFRRALADGLVERNPVAVLLPAEKPKARRAEARWLEVPDAARLLDAARHYTPTREDLAMPFAHELVAAFLLTGGRLDEVLGLEVDDVSLQRGTVTFRPNGWRRLKTSTSHRPVPLWPQLADVLRAYFPEREKHPGTLLFPSFRTGREAMLTDVRKLLDAVAARAGWKPGEITSKMFRHTYCAARLQTLDGGAPVSVYTVGKELGHGGDAMVRRVYGHLGQVRHRAEVVEYRVTPQAPMFAAGMANTPEADSRKSLSARSSGG